VLILFANNSIMSKTYLFEAETERLLELLTHSIYSNKEIFLRELISNASDAIDKARIRSLTDVAYLGDDNAFSIRIESDEDAKTVTIEDNGVGMNQSEVIAHIGTIAKSGTKDFLDKLKESKEQNNLIGQFWVGFYSAFMVAKKVIIETKSVGSEAVRWESEGKGEFDITESQKTTRGTTITLVLKEEESEFAKEWKLKELIKKYSNYLSVPIMMREAKKDENATDERNFETINETKALWNRPKNDLKDEDYQDFYQQLTYDFQKPLSHLHFSTEWVTSYTSILFIPKEKNPFAHYEDTTKDYGPKLFVQNVMILEHAKALLPVWLRFVSGVVQTSDLPLNISREMLQSNPTLDKIKKSLTKKVVDRLEYELKEQRESYEAFYQNYQRYLKEGVYYEHDLKEKIAWVLLFESLLESKFTSLGEYLEKTTPPQEGAQSETPTLAPIYYITATSKSEALSSPYLDQFSKKWINVLLLTDPIDEWLVSSLTEFLWHQLVSITQADLELDAEDEVSKQKKETQSKELKDVLELLKNTVGSEILEEVRVSTRLGDHLGALTTKAGALTPQMEKMMKAMGQAIPSQKRILEVNPDHPIIRHLSEEFQKDLKSEKINDLMLYIYEQALLLEWGELKDYKAFVQRVNRFIK